MASLKVASDGSELARGWAKMQDQHGEYFINLYTKETSRIRPVRASVFEQGAFPAPPQPQQPQRSNSSNDPISPMSQMSPHTQQQAYQQQQYNQQLYQQRWQNCGARSFGPQSQQWQFHQQAHAAAGPHPHPHPQNGIMPYHNINPPNVFPNQMQQIQQIQQPYLYSQEDEDEEEISSASASSSSAVSSCCTDTESSTVGTDSEEDEDEHQAKQQLHIKAGPPPNTSLLKQQKVPKAVPPVKQNVNHAQYRFQPIMPPNMNMMNMGKSNDSVNSPSYNMPSPAFNPNKVAATSHNNLPAADSVLDSNPSALEGNELKSLPVSEDEASLSAPPNPVIEHHESMIFGAMLQQKDKKQHLVREENWEMLCDGIQSNCPLKDQYDVFKAMRKVAKNLLLDDEKYRVLYADNDMVQKKILGRVGGFEFLRGIGFKQGNEENELMVSRVDKAIVSNAMRVMQKRIDALKKKRHEWDPKYIKKKVIIRHDPKQHQVDEEQRQLEEAIRLSQQQHVQDTLLRQQKQLDQHQKARYSQKSVNIFSPHTEDDYKAAYM